jgi:hypothetical protein
MDTWIGLDLGQMQSFAAAAVLRRTPLPERTSAGAVVCRFDCLAIKRYPLGTSYADIVRHMVEQAQRPELWADRPPRICVDKTGCGAAVLEMLRTALKPFPTLECWGIVITAGKAVTRPGPREVHVAKVELAGAIRQVLEDGRLRVPPRLEFAEALKRELQDFTVRVTDAANETFSASGGGWDDLVIATALPVWLSGWLDSRGVPFIVGPGMRVLPPEYRSAASRAATMGGIVSFCRQPFDRDRQGCRRW